MGRNDADDLLAALSAADTLLDALSVGTLELEGEVFAADTAATRPGGEEPPVVEVRMCSSR